PLSLSPSLSHSRHVGIIPLPISSALSGERERCKECTCCRRRSIRRCCHRQSDRHTKIDRIVWQQHPPARKDAATSPAPELLDLRCFTAAGPQVQHPSLVPLGKVGLQLGKKVHAKEFHFISF